VRTGAATAVAAKYLARKDSEVVGIIGCGVQGESNIEALMVVQDNIKRVISYDIIKGKAEGYSERMRTRYPEIEFVAAQSPKDAVCKSDIIVTAGPILKDPVQTIEAEWFREGAFASPVDFDSYWKPEAMKKADKFCTDDIGQLEYYKKVGYFKDIPEIYSDLGEIAAGNKKGRENEQERIISVNLGIAMEDIAVGTLVYKRALDMGIGLMLEL
jgi:ornithine cyclodeaminase/alanine dehydrogenase-like protein (mu-crystallin family)